MAGRHPSESVSHVVLNTGLSASVSIVIPVRNDVEALARKSGHLAPDLPVGT